MGKTELIKIVAEATGLSSSKTDEAIKAMIKAIIEADETTLVSFGKFKWKTRKARRGVNPSTREIMNIPAKDHLTFTMAPGLTKV